MGATASSWGCLTIFFLTICGCAGCSSPMISLMLMGGVTWPPSIVPILFSRVITLANSPTTNSASSTQHPISKILQHIFKIKCICNAITKQMIITKDHALDIQLLLDLRSYHAGEQLHASVNLRTANQVGYDCLWMEYVCEEECVLGEDEVRDGWLVGDRRDNREVVESLGKGGVRYRRKLVGEKRKIAEFQNGLARGDYAFPFCFTIGQDMPGTLKKTGRLQTAITHKALIYLTSKLTPSITPSITSSLSILQSPSLPNTPHSASQTTHLTQCLCLPQGHSTLWARIPTAITFPGSTLPLSLSVINTNCRRVIQFCSITLTKILTFKSHNEESTVTRMETAGVEPGQDKKLMVEIPIPKELEPTATGGKVRMWYRLAVEARVKGCVDDAPVIQAEVLVGGQVGAVGGRRKVGEVGELGEGFRPYVAGKSNLGVFSRKKDKFGNSRLSAMQQSRQELYQQRTNQ